jgi:general secretion pathway protein C
VLAIIAYFQAKGVVQLVTSSALALDTNELAGGSLKKPPVSGAALGVRTPRTSEGIIAHNPFDHTTDLKPKPPPPPEEIIDRTPKTVDLSDPVSAEICQGIKLHIVTESDDPVWSIAVLQGPKEPKGALRRVGDKVEDLEVAYIGFNHQMASPAVWMVKDMKLCQALLFAKEGAKPPTAATPEPDPAASQVAAKAPPTPAEPRGVPGLAPEIATKIEKVSESEFNVERAVIDNILENQSELMRSARIVPEKGADGKTVGIRLFGVRSDTLLGTLGLQNGDRLETINGFNMASPEDALNAYARLRTANKLTVKVTRRGKPMTMDFNIK